ncbi:hypothetical protein OAD24_06900 [Pseudomonadales bacterium]|nr:hypothetical protein [Pseudomonadales bacterium]
MQTLVSMIVLALSNILSTQPKGWWTFRVFALGFEVFIQAFFSSFFPKLFLTMCVSSPVGASDGSTVGVMLRRN